MAIGSNPLLMSAGVAGYEIERSLKINSEDSAYLSRTPTSEGNRQKWTWAGWIKRCGNNSNETIFSAGGSNTSARTNINVFFYQDDDATHAGRLVIGDGNGAYLRTEARFRDPSAWGHLVIVTDTTLSTASDRIKVYWNGVRITDWNADTLSTNVAQNAALGLNTTERHTLGNRSYNSSLANYSDLYLADIHFIDGIAVDPSNFGEFDNNNVWQPIEYSGSYGTNGFHLDFSDNSSADTLGTDTSGNGNDWDVYNIESNTSDVIYASTGTAAVSGVVSNGGTPYWVDIEPTNADLAYNGAGIDVVHDGSLSTRVYWVGSDYSQGNVTRARFDLRDFPTVTSVRIYAEQPYIGPTYNPYSVRLLDSSKNVISGTSLTINNSTPQWLTVSVSGSPAFIEFYRTSTTGDRLYLFAIEVNGQMLVNRLNADDDSLFDSPTISGTDTGAGGELSGNYATLNNLAVIRTQPVFSQGNLKIRQTASQWDTAPATIGINSGKWYWEGTFKKSTSSNYQGIGVHNGDFSLTTIPGNGNAWYYIHTGVKNSSSSATSYGASYTTGDVIGVALDMDAGTITFYKNGSSQGTAYSNVSGTVFPGFSVYGSNSSWDANFGQRAFASTAPSGYKALCTANLDNPTIADGSTAMDVITYSGNNGSQSISGLNFSPDLVWIKNRSGAYNHVLLDTIRGTGKYLASNLYNAEANSTGISSFDSNGFSFSSGWANTNGFFNYVAWAWDAGSSTVSNTDGDVTSSVRANPNAGFSIVKWNPSSSGQSVGHGLNAVPELIIAKALDVGHSWRVYHKNLSSGKNLLLDSTDPEGNYTGDIDIVNSTVFDGSSGLTGSSLDNNIAYCFTSVEGYSAMGSYIGNASTSGPFVYCGFRPRWLMIKNADSATNWVIYDTERDSYNWAENRIFPNSNLAEGSLSGIEILSNGFRPIAANGTFNGSGNNHIFLAFAEHPFKYARAR